MNITEKEIKRQYRVLQQILFMHLHLKRKYARSSVITKCTLIVCSVIFCATTFCSEKIYHFFGIQPEQAKIYLGISAILAFAASLVLLILDWEGKSAQHKEAASKWSSVLHKYRETKDDNGNWPDKVRKELSESYWEADRNSIKIPDSCFNKLKTKYLIYVEVSKRSSKYPGCPKFILWLLTFFSGTILALKECSRKEESNDIKDSKEAKE